MHFIHVFEDHEHSSYAPKETMQVHAQESACDMCLCHLSEAILADSSFETVILNEEILSIVEPYRSLHKYQQLPFSLRAPPSVS